MTAFSRKGLPSMKANRRSAASGPKRRGRIRRRTGHNLLLRLRDHKEDTLRFLHDPTVPFTNNQAERDLRMMKVRQKISGGFRSDTGAQTFATLRTVLSTARKQGWNILATLTTPPATLTQNLLPTLPEEKFSHLYREH